MSVIGLAMGAKHSLKQKLAERSNTLAQAGAADNDLMRYTIPGTAPTPSCSCSCPTLDTRCNKVLNVENCTCIPYPLET